MRNKGIDTVDNRELEKIATRARRQRAGAVAKWLARSVTWLVEGSAQVRRVAAACTAARLHRKDKNHDAFGTA